MRLTITILIFISLGALGGCVAGLALITSPDIIAKLEKEADRYMVMETDVEIEGKLETIKGTWQCTQSPSFNEGTMRWYMDWQGYPKVAYFAKALPSGKYLIMAVSGIYCSKNQSEFEHRQNVGLLDLTSSTLQILNNGQYKNPHDSRIKRSIIRVHSSPEKIEYTADELKVANQFLKQNPFYAYVVVNVWDETAWEDNPVVKERITPLTTLAFASDLHYLEAHKKGHAFGDLAYDKTRLGYMRFPVINGKLDLTNLDLIKAEERIHIYGWNANTKKDDYEVCFADYCKKVVLRAAKTDQIYNPNTNSIIQITWPIRSLGRNLNQLLE